MVKRIKRFIVFCLFSLVFSLVSGRVNKIPTKTKSRDNKEQLLSSPGSVFQINSAEAGYECVPD